MVEYIRKRAAEKVRFITIPTVKMKSWQKFPPLFDWVIENLLKNALDAMEGEAQ